MRAGRAGAGSWTAADARARGQIDTGKMTRMLGKGLELKSQNLTRMAGQLGNQGSFRQADRVLEAARSAASQGRGLDPGSSRFDRIERDSYKQEIHVRTRQASELAARGDAQGAARAISRVQSIQQQQGVKQGFFKSIFNGDRFTMNRLMKQQPVQQALARTGTGTGGAAAGRTSGGSGSMGSGAQMAVSQARYSQGGLSSRIAGGGAAGRPGGAMASLRPGPGAGAGPVGRMGR